MMNKNAQVNCFVHQPEVFGCQLSKNCSQKHTLANQSYIFMHFLVMSCNEQDAHMIEMGTFSFLV
jgi:hypothetical protein